MVNYITTSDDDDETQDPQTSRGPGDEEAVLAGHENVIHILLWIPYKWSRYDYDWSSIGSIAILAPQLPLVEWSSYDYNRSSASDVAILPQPMQFVGHNYTPGLCPRSLTTITPTLEIEPIDPLHRSDKPPRDLREFRLGTPRADKVLSDSESRTTMKIQFNAVEDSMSPRSYTGID
uniref:Mucin-like n=1 Tax=Oryza sativa subsp. japonica TaxID=39947 RepID=Q69T80_ORYSJ|nr:mucin-like [Oryza sativa Japonica Group]